MRRDVQKADKHLSKLRHRAQAFLGEKNVPEMSREDVRKLVHELDTYQIELELQNEDLRKSQQQLSESRLKYTDLYDFAPVGYCTVSEKGIILQANLTAADMLGVERSHLLRQPLSAFIVPADQDIYYQYRKALLTSGEEQSCELRIQNRYGRIYDVLFKGSIRQEMDGDQGRFRICLTDISGIKELENDIRKAKEDWEKIFDAIPDIITLQDKEMRILRANRATCVFFGITYENLIGKYCHELFRGESEPCLGCPLLESSKEVKNCSGIIEHEKLGKVFHISSTPVLNQQGEFQHLVHIAKDITEQKRLEEELMQSHKMEAIGTLAGGIAHDFNNILMAMIGYTELAKTNIPPDNPANNDLEMVLQSGKRAADLVQQILTFSRKADHQLQLFHPHLIVQESMRMLQASLPSTLIVKQDIDSDCGMIRADPTNIHRIIVNLCTNALHAMKDEKGILTIKLSRREVVDEEIGQNPGVSAGTFVVLSVSDTGCGMDEEQKEHIFEPYFTTKETGQGTGLGLAVIHGIVKDYRGFIQVDSTPGKGSTFSIYLPASQEEESRIDEPAGKELEIQDILSAGKPHILVVDDEQMLVNIHKLQLENCGFSVTGTTESKEALEKIRAQPDGFDLLITDQTMPGMSGVDLVKAVHEIKPGFPVILCTGHSKFVCKDDVSTLGIKRYLTKPIFGNELTEAVKQVLLESKR